MSTTRPILFSAPMVRALLAGIKSQTRRIVKPQPVRNSSSWDFDAEPGETVIIGGSIVRLEESRGRNKRDAGELTLRKLRCPYGQPGDRLWVRETWAALGNEDGHPTNAAGQLCSEREAERFYRADAEGWEYGMEKMPGGRHFDGRWRPSIFMPRWASRITLEITSVRVERLQEISEADAIAEGIEPCKFGGWHNYLWHGNAELTDTQVNTWPHQFSNYNDPIGSYSSLWDLINGPGSWAVNPLVWVVAFRRVAP